MRPIARAYILVTIVAGGLLAAWQLSAVRGTDLPLLAVVAILTAAAQSAQVIGATDRSSYNVGLVGYAFAFVHWGGPEAMLVILIACLAEWIVQRLPWYIQAFNAGALALAITLASLVHGLVAHADAPGSWFGLAGLLAAGVVFGTTNHLMVGGVIYLARGETFREAGVFRVLTVIMDATLLAVGATAAIVWPVSQGAALLALVPLYMIYHTLRLPSLERQAITDPKTGLYNARYFNEVLQRELDRADRHDRPLTVVMGDLDLLRNINNTYGHLAGDTVLIGVAKLLLRSVREYDIVARIGGEEFAILMGETSLQEAGGHVEAIRQAVESASFRVSTSPSPIGATISFGLAERERAGQEATEIIHAADLALYKAKLTGRNKTCLSSDMVTDVTTRPMSHEFTTAHDAG